MAQIHATLRRPTYQPSPRWGQCAAPIGGKVMMWGGLTEDFVQTRSRPIQSVEVLDTLVEEWQHKDTSGEAPPSLYGGACAAVQHTVYVCCGGDGTSFHNPFHALDSSQWRAVRPTNQDQGPMPISGCAIVSIDSDKLALVGGYGSTMFVRDTRDTDGNGWTNELHLFSSNRVSIHPKTIL